HRIHKSDSDDTEVFVQNNFYYLCEVSEQAVSQELDDYEAEEAFTLEYVEPMAAINKNRCENHSPKTRIMLEREARVLEMLLSEGFFS
ncbi:MAG: NUDIX hydrolase, partial [Oscillospiraceae bacterium]